MAKKSDLPSVEKPDFIGPPLPPESETSVATLEPPADESTPAKLPKLKPAADLVSEMAQRQADLLSAAEELAARLAAGEEISESERLIFDGLGWNKQRIEQETARLRSVAEWQRTAGSNQELTAAITRRDALAESTPPEVEKLRAEIDRLQAEMHVKQETQRRAVKTVEGMEAARQNLRKQVPPHIRAAFDRMRGAIERSPLSMQTREANSRVRMIQSLLTGGQSEEDKVRHFQGVGRADQIVSREHGVNGGHTMIYRSVADTVWQAYLSELRTELPTLQKLVAESQPILDRQIAELEAGTLDIYIPQD